MKKWTSVLILSALLAGCGSGETANKDNNTEGETARYELNPDEPAWKIDKKEEPTEFTWYVNADWWNDSWGEDMVTKQIEKDLNIKVKFIKGDDTSLNTMFASEDLADFVTIFDASSQVAQQANTWAYPLNDLAEKYDPYWNKVASEDTMNWFQLSDGKTYGYPSYSNSSEDYEEDLIPANTNFIIRKDVYESIGEPDFGTPEEFVAGLKKIKEEFPDLIPFGFNALGEGTGSLGGAFQDFIGVPLTTENDEFYDRNLDEDYLTWMKTLREAHSEGLISDDSFTDDGTAFEEKIQTGRYATVFADGTAQMSGFLQDWYSANPGSEYIAIDGPQSTKGNEPTINQSGISGWMINYINKDVKDPAKAIQLFTYLQSEYGGLLTTFGIEGETFQYDADGKIELLPEIQEIKDTDSERYKKEYRLSEFIFFGHDKYQTYASEKTATPALIQLREWGKGKLVPHFIIENTNPTPGTPEARNLSGINTNWNTTLVGMIRAGSEDEFDKLVENYKTFQKNNGWDEIVKIRTEKIKNNKEKLGME